MCDDLASYASHGVHRSAGAGNQATNRWIDASLKSIAPAMQTELVPTALPSHFELETCELVVGHESLECMPVWMPNTGRVEEAYIGSGAGLATGRSWVEVVELSALTIADGSTASGLHPSVDRAITLGAAAVIVVNSRQGSSPDSIVMLDAPAVRCETATCETATCREGGSRTFAYPCAYVDAPT